jgi:hypothetical protein
MGGEERTRAAAAGHPRIAPVRPPASWPGQDPLPAAGAPNLLAGHAVGQA